MTGNGQTEDVPWYRSAAWYREFSEGGADVLSKFLGPSREAGKKTGEFLARLVTSERKLSEIERILNRQPMTDAEQIQAIKAVVATDKDV